MAKEEISQWPTNRLPAEDRYYRDPAFHRLVDFIYGFLESDAVIGRDFTPSEFREALMCALTMYEHRHIRPMLIFKDKEDWGFTSDHSVPPTRGQS
jgi:hypothetical protein